MYVTSPGATDMRMGVLVDLAPGGELRFFGADAGRHFSVFTREDLAWEGSKPQILWSPVVKGDTIGVEITLPSRAARSTFSFRVDRISHGYRDGVERAPESGHVPEAPDCPGYHRDYQQPLEPVPARSGCRTVSFVRNRDSFSRPDVHPLGTNGLETRDPNRDTVEGTGKLFRRAAIV